MVTPAALLPRRAAALVEAALAGTRVVLIQGAGQVIKATGSLVRREGAEVRTLDDPAMHAAQGDAGHLWSPPHWRSTSRWRRQTSP
jgi:glutamate dehydrogenase/leucine dehydrogenase